MLLLHLCVVSYAFIVHMETLYCGVIHSSQTYRNKKEEGGNIVDGSHKPGQHLDEDGVIGLFQEGEPLNELDYVNGNKLNLDDSEDTLYLFEEDPLLKAGLFEGDINIMMNTSSLFLDGRNAILDNSLRWVDGIIPYSISSEYNSHERSVIARAMSDYHSKTCIRFKPRTINQFDYIYLAKGQGCSSAVGRQGGGQEVSLGQGCVHHGVVVHELMHATGFWHEQSRADRDNYITIVWSNIMQGMEYNFQKYSWKHIQDLGEAYDLGSVMHYDAFAFSARRGQPTILSKDKSRTSRMGQRQGFSSSDIRRINILYDCMTDSTINTLKPMGKLITQSPFGKVVIPKPDSCLDIDTQCSAWAQSGECDKNPIWMKVNCLQSCGICDSSCVDHSTKCKAWAVNSECQNNPNYMLNYCKKSCGVC